jgi:hypothetical protein
MRPLIVGLLLAISAQACGGRASGPTSAPATDGGEEASPQASFDGGSSDSEQPCAWMGLDGVDAACSVGADCPAGQTCLVAVGCFCATHGGCVDHASCLEAPSAGVDLDAGVVYCMVNGC